MRILAAVPYLALLFTVAANAQSAPVPTPSAASAPTLVPALVPYTGVAAAADGRPLTGEASAMFLLFKEERGGEPLWTESQTVTIDNSGHYEVKLGASSANGLPLGTFAAGDVRWLEVQIAGQSIGPRVLLTSVPYALKAADAATFGGLPPSAYVLASTMAGSGPVARANAITPDASASNVTTIGGTNFYVPRFNAATTVINSQIYDNGKSVGIGDVPNASAKLDVNGAMIMRGNMQVTRTGNATTSTAYPSYGFQFYSNAYNSSSKASDNPYFQLQSEPTGNNTSSPSATFNLLFSDNGSAPAETGFFINVDGTINFSNDQTFAGTSADGTAVNGTSSFGIGVEGTSYANVGVVGYSTNSSGIYGSTAGNTGNTAGVAGAAGQASGLTGGISGIWGDAYSHVGVLGTSNQYPGVQGTSVNAQGVQGNSTAGNGVHGVSANTSGVFGETSSTSAQDAAVFGYSRGAAQGVYGFSASNSGVQGLSTSGTGVAGTSSSANGVLGYTGGGTLNTAGVTGQAGGTSGFSGIAGVWGDAKAHVGVFGSSTSYAGVIGESTNGPGVQGASTNGYGGMFSTQGAGSTGLQGVSTGGTDSNGNLPTGIYGSSSADGVRGYSTAGVGVHAIGRSTQGMFAGGNQIIGVLAEVGDTPTGIAGLAIVGLVNNGAAGYLRNDSVDETLDIVNDGGGPMINPYAAGGNFMTLRASTPDGVCGFGSKGTLTCSGQLKSLATTGDGAKTVETYSMQSPENWMEDFGSGTLQNGAATISLEAAFAETVSGTADYHVFLTPRGDCNGLYVTNLTAKRFEVHELNRGTTAVGFDYRIVAKRRGFEAQRMVDVTEAMKAADARGAERFPKAAKASRPTQ